VFVAEKIFDGIIVFLQRLRLAADDSVPGALIPYQTNQTTMKKLIAALIVSLLSVSAYAEEANKKCPVSGKDVDAAVTSTLSVTVGFCCSKCQGKFDTDATAKTDAIQKYAGSKDSPANKKCVYNASKDAKADNTATASKTVSFCCDKCKAAFEKDPQKYITKVK